MISVQNTTTSIKEVFSFGDWKIFNLAHITNNINKFVI